MLLSMRIAAGIADGSITVQFRRWDVPRVRVGRTQRTAAGVVTFTSVQEISVESLTDADARAAGETSLMELTRVLAKSQGSRLFRIGVAQHGPDERVSLRAQTPDEAGLQQIAAALADLDRRRRTGPWTSAILEQIEGHPGELASTLAQRLARETRSFKADVRRLKELGLTVSLPVGYDCRPGAGPTSSATGRAGPADFGLPQPVLDAAPRYR